MSEHEAGLLDTSVLIDVDRIAPDALPGQLSISALTLAELAAGPHATADLSERARRQDRLQRTETAFDALPFDEAAARAFGVIAAAIISSGRKPRGRRTVDLMIAATALSVGIPLFTRNPADLDGLADLLTVVPVPLTA